MEWSGGELVAAFEVTNGATKYGTLEDFGGGALPSDADHFQTAIRESHEETCGLLRLSQQDLEAAPLVSMPSLQPNQAYATFLPILNGDGEPPVLTSKRLRDATAIERSREHPRPTWLEAADVRFVALRALVHAAKGGGGALDSTTRVVDVNGREVRLSPRGLALVNAAYCQGVLDAVMRSQAPA